MVIVAAPWYTRNLVIGGSVVPPTGWTDKAVHALSTLLPYLTGMCGFIYLAAAIALNSRFVYLAIAMQSGTRAELPMRTFKYSITYLMLLFAALIVDHYLLIKV